ncbi:MAG: hypothetical protein ACFB0E_05775 [Leptolyngbyaceae cyanobacterium]
MFTLNRVNELVDLDCSALTVFENRWPFGGLAIAIISTPRTKLLPYGAS